MELTHIDEKGNTRMVDVGDKMHTRRVAKAQSVVTMQDSTLNLIVAGKMPKGDVFACARVAGIMAAKKTSDLVPMCHPLPLEKITIDIEPINKTQVRILATAQCTYKTGVEMEALTAATMAGLTIYDMCKAVDRTMRIDEVFLLHKDGGKSGVFNREI
ncbi:MAG: cyclic pyranopterin monophosphate synthase MoaC [Acutalibacteraceae bacterium]|jgi:cyclic pyranopterin phosphate synthase|nr:cyclic pyranopterin monophosphate synthase MoaC [Clostridiales bacterium]